MQISITNLLNRLLFITLCCIQSANAETTFMEYFQVESVIDTAISDRITQYHSENISLTPIEQQRELNTISASLNVFQAEYANNAQYWFIKGLHNKNLAAFYAGQKNSSQLEKHLAAKDKAYKKALQISKEKPGLLSAAIYSTMKHGLPPDLKIQAIQAEISQGGNTDNSSAYWFLHWSNIDELKKAGRDKEAELAYQNMKKEMQQNKVDISIYKDFNNKIENQTLKATAQVQKTSAIQNKESGDGFTGESLRDLLIPVLFMIALTALLAVTYYEFFVKPRKK